MRRKTKRRLGSVGAASVTLSTDQEQPSPAAPESPSNEEDPDDGPFETAALETTDIIAPGPVPSRVPDGFDTESGNDLSSPGDDRRKMAGDDGLGEHNNNNSNSNSNNYHNNDSYESTKEEGTQLTAVKMGGDPLPTIQESHHHEHHEDNSSVSLPPPDRDESSFLPPPSSEEDNDNDHDHDRHNNQTLIEEKEMRRKLMDMESSFLPEPSTIGIDAEGPNTGADDTYLVGVAPGENQTDGSQVSPFTRNDTSKAPAANQEQRLQTPPENQANNTVMDPDATPAVHHDQEEGNTSSLETISSSPTAAAAARTVSRVLSTSSKSTNTNERPQEQENDRSSRLGVDDGRTLARSVSPAQSDSRLFHEHAGEGDITISSSGSLAEKRKRPKYLNSRQSSHRFSASSVASDNTDATHMTLGADYALQSGGAVPGHGDSTRRQDLARTISLGSMASGISGYSDENLLEKRNNSSGTTETGLHTLDEEGGGASQSRPTTSSQKVAKLEEAAPVTPKAKPPGDAPFPTDSAIAEHVRDIQVPGTIARQFRDSHGQGVSPEKHPGAPTPGFGRSGRSMTLKEQSSTIDRLSKENFDLKMRIHFLNEALNKRSEEGIKEMISENVELKSDKLKLQKDNQHLRRKVRDLEKQLKDREQPSDKESIVNNDPEGSDDEDRHPPDEEELLYLRERMEQYEVEIERLRSESIARESEKRRLAEMVKALGDGRPIGSEAGAREERDMWKDMLDAETAAREQAEEENRRLRDEILQMKTEMGSGRAGRRGRLGSAFSHSTASEPHFDRTAIGSSSSNTLVELELLKQENAELRREVSAQTSMLTSRNREKERLYQEIEELKLGQRRDGSRSVAGDSIFERSASRAHSPSRVSDGMRGSTNDTERENLEIKNGELRDQVSALKLENHNIRAQLDEYMSELETLDKAYQADVEQAEEEIQTLSQERDHAFQVAEEREIALQELKAEAQAEIDALGEELDQKIEECQHLQAQLRSQEENLNALQAEMRSASEGIIRLEEDAQSNLQKYKSVQQELDDANREIESLEKSLFEANNKVQRLTVQLESSQNEIAFLREEQDGDKIKIGDLESELKTTHMNLQSEKEKTRELEHRLAEERHQREVVGSKEKQEVQRMMNELNREATAAKEEVRKLKKNLSAREIEATTWKERLTELEDGLREALGDLNGTRSSLLNNIVKLQKELESTALELESTRSKLDERESLLKNREALLESHGLESRKLADLLERERQARRADKHSFEQALKSHQQASRTLTQNNSRISDLEAARNQDRKRYGNLEQQYKDQLSERNAMFLTIWKRLSAMCGPDWAHSNSLINGNLPSQEVIGNILFWPGFSRNLLLAVKTVENLIAGFKSRIKAVERDLTKQYQTLEHNLSLKLKRLDRLEEAVKNLRTNQHKRTSSSLTSSPEIAKLRGENRLLKAELNLLQSNSRARVSASAAAVAATAQVGQGPERVAARNSMRSPGNNAASSLVRHNSTSTVESGSGNGSQPASRSDRSLTRSATGIPQPSNLSGTTLVNSAGAVSNPSNSQQGHGANEPNQEKWIQRLRELERRLKAEREARLLDRNEARKRLEERSAKNEELRAQLERERMRREAAAAAQRARSHTRSRSRGQNLRSSEDDTDERKRISMAESRDSDYGYRRDEDESSDGVEGITVDIEV
ncbi:hypothetical protein VTN00DRAFT_7427 [Thermoascus crustaceus]|uniref:uncharacterized protein n=1 Tax=Thermoascus crustaceus TaxID=5088 RepID=UPI0037443DE0